MSPSPQSRSIRLGVSVLAAGAALAAGAGPAWSASARMQGDTVRYTAAPGERNVLDVAYRSAGVVFHDAGAAISAGPGCRVLGDGGVACGVSPGDPGPVATRVIVHLGDRDDSDISEVENSGGLTTMVFYGGSGNDTLHSGSGVGNAHRLYGGPGDDTLRTMTNHGGDATLVGGSGDDVLINGEGGAARWYGGPGDDHLGFGGMTAAILAFQGGAGADVYDTSGWDEPGPVIDSIVPGPGIDTLDGSLGGPLSVDLIGCGHCVERVLGSPGDDVIRGDGRPNVLFGAGGNDTIDPRGGRDTVRGDEGDDTLALVDGALDRASCGDGDDAVRADLQPPDLVAADCEHVTAQALREARRAGT